MNFAWKKNSLKERIFFNKNNDDLLEELKEKRIIDNNILSAIKKVPRELFINQVQVILILSKVRRVLYIKL